MLEQPLVSIAAINYNNAAYVVETLNSIAQQTYPNTELIIVDDCSTDNSVQLITEWLAGYAGRYQFIKHDVNKGVCKACNSGLNHAKGKYFSIIATDDLMAPEKLAIQVPILEQSDEGVAGVYTDATLIDEHGNALPGMFIDMHRQFETRPNGDLYDILLQGNFIPGMTFLFKKEVLTGLGGYDERLAYEDYDMWLRISQRYQLLYHECPVCSYRIRQGSLSSTIRNWHWSDARIFLKHVGAALPMPRIRRIAETVYLEDDASTLAVVDELAAGTGDVMLVAISMLWHYECDKATGRQVMDRVAARIAAGAAQVIMPGNADAGTDLTTMQRALAEQMAQDVYDDGYTVLLEFIKTAALRQNNRYVMAAYLLGHYGIGGDTGDAILNLMLQQGAQTITGKESNDNATLLMANVYPVIPGDLVKKITYGCYEQGLPWQQALPALFYNHSSDMYVHTVMLLQRHNIPVAVGAIIAERINGYCIAGRNRLYIRLCIYKDISEARRRYKTRLP